MSWISIYLAEAPSQKKKELPLMLNENQMYIHYHKGSLVFYALKDYLGEEMVNRILRDYIADVAFQQPPYTRAIDLVQRFKEAAPADKQYLIEDMFETITFYENRTQKVVFEQTEDGNYEVEICSTNKKMRANELGEEEEIPLDDFVDVGLFDTKGNLIYLQKHKIEQGQNTFRIVVNTKPSKGGVDPLNKLIDKFSDGHVIKATSR